MLREAQIDSLASFLVSGLIAKGIIKPKGDSKDIIALVVEFLSENFETEAKIDEEADRTSEDLARKKHGMDVTRLRTLTRQKLAEKKGFVL
jgi:hypothetical protein